MPRSRAAFSRGRSLNGRNPSRKVSFAGKNKWHRDYRGAHGAFLVIGRCYLIKHNNLVVDAVVKLRRILLIKMAFLLKKKKKKKIVNRLRERCIDLFRKIAFFFNGKKECSCCFVDLYFLIFLFSSFYFILLLYL